MKLKLVSFKICPFVQRSAITLLEKGIDYDIVYIDLQNPPDWFLAISPFGKVPILCVDGPCGTTSPLLPEGAKHNEGAIIFESAVIMEFLDETHPPSMHPKNPLQRAHNREWIEFNSNMNLEQHDVLAAPDKETYEKRLDKVRKDFRHVESQLQNEPYFNGDAFSLIDAAYAPIMQRYKLIEPTLETGLFRDFPKIDQWAQNMLQRDSIQQSVVPEFNELYLGASQKWNGYVATLFPESSFILS